MKSIYQLIELEYCARVPIAVREIRLNKTFSYILDRTRARYFDLVNFRATHKIHGIVLPLMFKLSPHG